VSILDLFATANAWASAAGAEHHTPSIGEVVLPAINFIIYAGIIYYYAVPLVRNILRSRRDDIVSTIVQASAKKQQAEAQVNEYRSKLAGVAQEVQSILVSLGQEAQREKEKIVTEAQALAARLREDARFLADREVDVARERIREELASQAEALARVLVQRNISPADQSRLAQEFLSQIGQTR
jgi:F-type H+-transporting ATPase subunit b